MSVAVRLASASFQGDSVTPLPGVYDQVSYHALAQRVLQGAGFSFDVGWWPATRAGEPTAHWSFLYTLFLALNYAVVGVHPLVPRLIQGLMSGVVQPWLTYRLANRLFGSRVGLVAALMSAVYAYFAYYAGSLITETFYILAVLWVFDASTRLSDPHTIHSKSGWLELGAALGIAVLLRQAFLLFVPVLFAWFVWPLLSTGRRVGQRYRVLGGFLLSTVVLAGLILPWTVRNYFAFKRFVLLNSNAGYVLFWANHPVHGTRFIPILPNTGPSYGELIPQRLRALDEASLERELLLLALKEIGHSPKRYLALVFSRSTEFFRFWPSSESSVTSNLARTMSFGLLLPFALLGVCISARSGFRRSSGLQQREGRNEVWRTRGIWLLLLFVVTYTLIHLFSWALIRYRVPIDAILVIFGTVGVLSVADLILAAGNRNSPRMDLSLI